MSMFLLLKTRSGKDDIVSIRNTICLIPSVKNVLWAQTAQCDIQSWMCGKISRQVSKVCSLNRGKESSCLRSF